MTTNYYNPLQQNNEFNPVVNCPTYFMNTLASLFQRFAQVRHSGCHPTGVNVVPSARLLPACLLDNNKIMLAIGE